MSLRHNLINVIVSAFNGDKIEFDTFIFIKEITDNLIEILTSIIQRIGTRAERRINKELVEDFKLVEGKTNLLFRLAEVAVANPEGVIQSVVYPVLILSQETLKNLVKEYKSTGVAYRQKVHTVSYAFLLCYSHPFIMLYYKGLIPCYGFKPFNV